MKSDEPRRVDPLGIAQVWIKHFGANGHCGSVSGNQRFVFKSALTLVLLWDAAVLSLT